MVVVGAATGWFIRKQRERSLRLLFDLGVFCVGPLAMVTYALRAPDPLHQSPLAVITCFMAIVGFSSWNFVAFRSACIAGLVLLLLLISQGLLRDLPSDGCLTCGKFQRVMNAWTAECDGLIPPGTRSIFVGETTNRVGPEEIEILYVPRPDIRPATKYISVEDTMGFNCSYRSRIVTELMRAPRPMIAFMHLNPAEPDLPGCGQFQTYLETAPSRDLGTCKFRNLKIRARLYMK